MGLRFAPYSFSKISTWKQCPRKFNYNYVQKLPKAQASAYALDRGKLIHLILECNFDLIAIKSHKDFKGIVQSEFLSKSDIKDCFKVAKDFKESPAGQTLFKRKMLFAEMAIGLDFNLAIQEYND